MSRLRIAWWLAACLALVASYRVCAAQEDSAKRPPASESERHDSPGSRALDSGSHSINIDAQDRTFLLDVPKDLQPGAALVMVFHGYGDSPESIRKFAGFTPLVEKHGFVAVYPQGTHDDDGQSFFNVGYDFHKHLPVDDVKFVRELAARLVHEFELDPRSVFATGMSNGGDMCYYLACQPGPFVRACAPVAGCMLADWTRRWQPSARLSLLEVHGTSDKLTWWDGDLENRDGYGAYLGTAAVMQFWVQRLKLERAETRDIGSATAHEAGESSVRQHAWSTAVDLAEVRLYEIEGGGHEWPVTLGSRDTSTAEVIWDFFQRHRPPTATHDR